METPKVPDGVPENLPLLGFNERATRAAAIQIAHDKGCGVVLVLFRPRGDGRAVEAYSAESASGAAAEHLNRRQRLFVAVRLILDLLGGAL
jgi:hypothetical protein